MTTAPTMKRLVVVVPLKPGNRSKVREILAAGPPFELVKTDFDRHDVFLTDDEAIFLFEGERAADGLRLPGDEPELWRAAEEWKPYLAGQPRVASTAFSWTRSGAGRSSSDEWDEDWGE
jgi:hypothetical protein